MPMRPLLVVYTPNLREHVGWPGVTATVHFDHIARHYHDSHDTITPRRIIPFNPVIDWSEPHVRA